MRYVPLFILYICSLTFSPSEAISDEWYWRRITWTGTGVLSVTGPPDSSQVMYVIPNDPPADSIPPGVYKSSDSGMTWEFLSESYNPEAYIVTVHPTEQQVVYCGIPSEWVEPTYWPRRSRDAGKHWEEIYTSVDRITASPVVPDLLFGTNRHSHWYLQRSTDDGETWEGLAGCDGPGLSDNVVFDHGNAQTVFAAYYCTVQDTMGLARSTNDGADWEMVLEGMIVGFDQDPKNSDHWAAVISTGQNQAAYFAESFDGADTWIRRELPDVIDYLRQVLFDLYDSKTIYLVGARRGIVDLGIYRSIDGGYTWETMNDSLPLARGTSEVLRLKDPPGEFLAARTDGLWRWTNRVGAEDYSGVHPTGIVLGDFAPNPFYRTTEGFLNLPAGGYFTATIYSIQGRMIRILTDTSIDSGDISFVWDGNNALGEEAPAGAYILTVRSNSETLSRKLIKLR